MDTAATQQPGRCSVTPALKGFPSSHSGTLGGLPGPQQPSRKLPRRPPDDRAAHLAHASGRAVQHARVRQTLLQRQHRGGHLRTGAQRPRKGACAGRPAGRAGLRGGGGRYALGRCSTRGLWRLPGLCGSRGPCLGARSLAARHEVLGLQRWAASGERRVSGRGGDRHTGAGLRASCYSARPQRAYCAPRAC
jgi:hypothetical protein